MPKDNLKRLEGVRETLSCLTGAIAGKNGQRLTIAEDLAELACPLLLVWGKLDAMVPMPQAGAMPARAKMLAIGGAGHMPQMETADVVNDAILENIPQAT